MTKNPNQTKFQFLIKAAAAYLLMVLLAVPAFAGSKADTTQNAPKQTILNKTGARPMDYDQEQWLDEKWGAHLGESYKNLKDSFSSPKTYALAPFRLVNLVLVGANETIGGTLNVVTYPIWGTEEKVRNLYGDMGVTRKLIRGLTDSIPGGRTFGTSVRRTFNFNYGKDKLYETFPASLITNTLAGDYRASWDSEHKIKSIIIGTLKTGVRVGSVVAACSGGGGGGSSGGGSSGGVSTGGGSSSIDPTGGD